MSTKKRFNCKARQKSKELPGNRGSSQDTNVFSLPAVQSKPVQTFDDGEPSTRRTFTKKLNSKQRQKLRKIVEAKKRKEKVPCSGRG